MAEHASVEEMVKALSSESFAAEFAEQNAKTQLSQSLSAARVASGMTWSARLLTVSDGPER